MQTVERAQAVSLMADGMAGGRGPRQRGPKRNRGALGCALTRTEAKSQAPGGHSSLQLASLTRLTSLTSLRLPQPLP